MLLVYSLLASGDLTAETISALRRTEHALAKQVLGDAFKDLGFRWDDVQAGLIEGTFARGYARAANRGRILALVDALLQLSREFPGVIVQFSGICDLLPTIIRAGEFEIFGESYDRALVEHRWTDHAA
jgi:hypothetical protein